MVHPEVSPGFLCVFTDGRGLKRSHFDLLDYGEVLVIRNLQVISKTSHNSGRTRHSIDPRREDICRVSSFVYESVTSRARRVFHRIVGGRNELEEGPFF